MKENVLLEAFKVSVPVLFGYLTLGIAYGILLSEHYPWWLASLSSLTMFAGAGQIMAVGLFAAGTPLVTILITELLLNVRHIVYGLSLITKFKGTKIWKPYLIFGLTDETYSLLTTCEVPEGADKGSFYGLITLFDHCYWFIGSTIGAVAGTLIPYNLEGIDFALTALFIVLTIEQIKKTKDFVPAAVGAAVTVILVIIWKLGFIKDANNILIFALCTGILVISLIKGIQEKRRFKSNDCRFSTGG